MLDYDALAEFLEQHIPFNVLLGLRVEHLSAGRAVLRMPFQDHLVGDASRPAIHGGAIGALIDATAGAAAFTKATHVERISTVDLRIDYLRPAPKTDLVATADVRRMGQRIAVVNVLVVPEGADPEPVAEGRGVF